MHKFMLPILALMKILLLMVAITVIVFAFTILGSADLHAQDTTATTMMLMQPAMTTMDTRHSVTKNSKPTVDDDYVTDEVTMPDGTKAFLKHKKNTTPPPPSNVVVDRASKFDNQGAMGDIYVYPVTVKGTPCVVVTTGWTDKSAVALSCGWKQ